MKALTRLLPLLALSLILIACPTSNPNTKPTADFTFTPTAPVAGQAVTFNAKDHSSDSDGKIVKYTFSFGDNSAAVSNATGMATHTFAAAGSYNVSLQVEDDKGAKSETKLKVVQVQAANQAPVAALAATPTSGTAPLAVNFDATGSTDDKGITKYIFDFADGSTAVENTTGKATHSYTSAGTYNAKVTVFDAENKSASKTVAITVQAKVCEGHFVIDGEDTAGDIAKVKDCNEITGELYIYETTLTNLSMLNKLEKVGGRMCIGCYMDVFREYYKGNAALTSLTGLEKLSSIGIGLSITSNTALTSLAGLENLSSLEGFLVVKGNAALTSLTGLENLSSIGGGLSIDGNAALTSLTGLENLSSIGAYLFIKGNAALTSLAGLEKLKEVKGSSNSKAIYDNPKFDCSPYNQNPPPYFPLTQSTGNKVNCTTQ